MSGARKSPNEDPNKNDFKFTHVRWCFWTVANESNILLENVFAAGNVFGGARQCVFGELGRIDMEVCNKLGFSYSVDGQKLYFFIDFIFIYQF